MIAKQGQVVGRRVEFQGVLEMIGRGEDKEDGLKMTNDKMIFQYKGLVTCCCRLRQAAFRPLHKSLSAVVESCGFRK